jgi:hypothetical protein
MQGLGKDIGNLLVGRKILDRHTAIALEVS